MLISPLNEQSLFSFAGAAVTTEVIAFSKLI